MWLHQLLLLLLLAQSQRTINEKLLFPLLLHLIQ
jgi:hypothetical protein